MFNKIKEFFKSFTNDERNNEKESLSASQNEIIKNKETVVSLKAEYDDIFVSNIKGLEFIFRPLTKFEFFEYIINNPGIKDIDLSEKIAELCVLYPERYDFKKPDYAGIPDILFEEIKEVSGFTNDEMIKAKAAEYRAVNEGDFDHQMENIIMTAFPSIKLEEMRDWNIYKLLDYFTRAEWVIQNMMPMHRLPYEADNQNIENNPANKGSSFFGMGHR